MTPSSFTRVPTEIVESWVRYLEPSDLLSFRLVCKQAYMQTFEAVGQTFFSVWRTTLMGSDLRKLEEISMHVELRKYIKTISIKDEGEIADPSPEILRPIEIPPIASLNIWPRDEERMITSSEIGVENLRAMLLDRRLCPETIEIRDYRRDHLDSYPEPIDALARDIIDGTNLAIVSISFRTARLWMSEAIISLSPQHQGQDMGFSLLHSAELRLSSHNTPFWSEQVFYHAPILENLTIDCKRLSTQEFDTLLSAGSPISNIKQFDLFGGTLPARIVLTILGNSKHSLTSIFFCMVTIREVPGWQTLLSSLGSDFPGLTSFHLKFLRELPPGRVEYRGFSKEKVAEEYRSGLELFEKGRPDNRRLTWLRYKGPGASGVLKNLATSIVVNRSA